MEANPKPSIKELGLDLLELTKAQLIATLAIPFAFFIIYFGFASNGFWIAAVLTTMAFSFTTYGSTSHDLVHENLKLSKKANAVLLSLLELLCFRSGHAYKISHLYHHKRYPHDDDVEGAAAKMTLFRSLLEGIIFQLKIYVWVFRHHRGHRYFGWVVVEGIAVLLLMSFCIYTSFITPVFFVYMCLMIAGSWIIPLVTSYAVHTPSGHDELRQTRLFRGRLFAWMSFNHLFHLEHHLYPMVPHKNWPELAARLDKYFESEGIKPHVLEL